MCFVSRPMKIVTFLRKKRDPAKRVVDFPKETYTFRNKIMEIVEDFDEKSYNNNGKLSKSSRILRVKPNFFICLSFFIISLHFSLFSCFSIFILFIFHLFIFSFSFIFFYFLSFSIICLSFFFHFLSFFLSFSIIFHHFSIIFYHVPIIFLSCFFHFLSFSVIFCHVFAFSFSLLGAQHLIFFGPQFRYDFS